MSKITKNKIVILCGPRLTHKHTCSTLIDRQLNVIGICEADQRSHHLPLSYIRRSFRTKGIVHTVSTILARTLYTILNKKKDQKIFSDLYDEEQILETVKRWGGPVHRTTNYSNPETISWLRSLEPDVLVVHTPYWVSKKVRDIPQKGIVLGGHPGITPYFRGSHSSFWAIYLDQPEMVGCTVFMLDSGVDTGDIVAQEIINIDDYDSFISLGWKGMKRIAKIQSDVLINLDAGTEIPATPVNEVPAGSEFGQPGITQYLKYLAKQNTVR